MMGFSIVPMEESHVTQIAALEKACFSLPWSEKSIRSELGNPLAVWLTAIQDGRVAGYIGSQAVMDEADVMNVAVLPAARRQGIARALLRALVSQLAARDVRMLTLEVRPGNEAAVRLYESEGFYQAGRRKKYYVNPVEDALILRKEWKI